MIGSGGYIQYFNRAVTVSLLAVVVIVHIDAWGVVQAEVLRLTPQNTYGMVWYGMVWYGIVWYGMVW